MNLNNRIINFLNERGLDITTDIKNVLRENNAIASGDLYNSVKFEVIKVNEDYKLIISYLDYGEFVLKGRKPNSKPPPISPIIRWTKFKGIPTSAAYPIAKSIGKKGIKPLNFLFPFFNKINQIERQLERDVAFEIEKMITIPK
jgi:hypothetical protein